MFIFIFLKSIPIESLLFRSVKDLYDISFLGNFKVFIIYESMSYANCIIAILDVSQRIQI